ncbi:MAG: hypothetical protein MUC88_27695 [Planctomycetes bacterium]|nr:hypothetical protein [Planctomycetota bacterium]
MKRGVHILTGLLLSLTSLSFSCASLAKSQEYLPGRQMGVIQSQVLGEISGIVASRRHPGVLYVHNDSDEAPRVYVLNEKAQLLGVYTIRGAAIRDWEDIAIGPGPNPDAKLKSSAPRPSDPVPGPSYLYIGDIGDNEAKRAEVVVYRVPEPQVDPAQPFGQRTIGLAEAVRLVYPDGPRDAETLLVDPLTGDLYLISKRDWVPRMYRAACPQLWHPGLRAEATTPRITLEYVGDLPFWTFPTGGDVSPDGRRVLIRGIFRITRWDRPVGAGPSNTQGRVGDPAPLWQAFAGKSVTVPMASEDQGEAICFDSKGTGYFTISEGTHVPLYYFGPAEPNAPHDVPKPPAR